MTAACACLSQKNSRKMPSQYGHTSGGINLTNYRLLAQSNEKKAQNTYRTPAEWREETKDHVLLSTTEQKQSSTLRQAGSLLQAAASDLVVADLSSVETALKSKILQTEALKQQLDRARTDVESEINACLSLKSILEERLSKVDHKVELNAGRLQVRDGRPTRERTMDDVERTLLQQQHLMSAFNDKVRRAIAQVEREVGQLEAVKAKLIADLCDKVDAIDVDTAVMAVGAQGEVTMTPANNRRNDHPMKTPHTWVRSTEENLALAKHWLTDSVRLRKAVRHAVQAARSVEHELSRSLNDAMVTKMNKTQHLRDNLGSQLAKVQEETTKALGQRQKLAAALEAKRGPLAQAKERFALRKARPSRETVQDEVEAALTREIAHLNAVTSQLTNKVQGVDKELDSLALAAAVLEDNIRDKEMALALDERCVMLDGRINVTTAPPSSVGSAHNSTLSTARSATMQRIASLEAELMTARREREAMETSVAQLRYTLASGSTQPASPSKLTALY